MYENDIGTMQDVLRQHTMDALQERVNRQQQAQQQSQPDPAQAYRMYQQVSARMATAPTSAGTAPAFTATTPGIAAGPEAVITSSAAPAAAAATPAAGAAAPAAAGAGGQSGVAAMFSNPWTALAAALAAASIGMDKKNISSFKSQLKGDTPNDLLNSPSVQKILPDSVIDSLRPWADLHGVKGFKNLPKDIVKSAKAPFDMIKKLFS